MITHKIPELRIHEVHTDHVVVYDNMADWIVNGSRNYSRSHFIACPQCKAKHTSASQFPDVCMVDTKIYNYSGDKPWYYDYTYKMLPNKDGHHLVYNVVIRDEFGYNFSLDELAEARDKYYENKYRYRYFRNMANYYLNSYYHPDNRGILEINQKDNDFNRKYRHMPQMWRSYRQIRFMNEKRQVEASMVDEHSPKVRPERNINNLQNNWDDYHCNYEKSWKRGKFKKQWMVNI